MPLESSARVTSQSLRITFAMNKQSSATVWSIGGKFSSRNDAENTAAIASASAAVARRMVNGVIWIAAIRR
jgi:hypothetical protein